MKSLVPFLELLDNTGDPSFVLRILCGTAFFLPRRDDCVRYQPSPLLLEPPKLSRLSFYGSTTIYMRKKDLSVAAAVIQFQAVPVTAKSVYANLDTSVYFRP